MSLRMLSVALPFILAVGCASQKATTDAEPEAAPVAEAAAEPAAEAEEAKPQTIVEIAVGNGSFNTLVTALKAAGLVETLSGEGPFTVFAPTDEAFAKLPEGALDALLADKEKLTAVLTYHVVSGEVMASDVVKLDSATTLEGSNVEIDASEGVRINDASVVSPDVKASNGVIHVIDSVLLPQS